MKPQIYIREEQCVALFPYKTMIDTHKYMTKLEELQYIISFINLVIIQVILSM